MMIRDRIRSGLLVAALFFPLALALYSGLRAGFERADFVFVNQGEVSSLDPALATGIPEGRVIMAISEGLATLHPETLEPAPACAASWDISEDGRTILFHLRKDLRWSDGTPLLAEDFLYSWRRLLDPATASPYAYLLWDVEGGKRLTGGILEGGAARLGLSVPDPYTFEVRLQDPCPYFVVLTAFYPLFPVSRNGLGADGQADWLDPERIICNGPFRVKARLLKDRIRLRKNPHYWDSGNVAIETIDALAVTSPVTALNLYLTGAVDWINNVPPLVLPFVMDREEFTLTPNLGTNFLRFNTTRPPLDDPRVRRAFHLAIDKQALSDYVLKGGQLPATSFVPPGIPGYTPPKCTIHDPDEARRLFALAGYEGGKDFPELNLLYSADETNRDICEVISIQLKRSLGIRVHPTAQERKGYFVSQNSLAYQICFCSWLGDYLDASTFLDIFRSDSGNNRTGWVNRAYDGLMDRAGVEKDHDARAVVMAQAETLLLQEMPLAPLYFRTTSNMIKPEWAGYFDNIQDVHPLKYLRRRE